MLSSKVRRDELLTGNPIKLGVKLRHPVAALLSAVLFSHKIAPKFGSGVLAR